MWLADTDANTHTTDTHTAFSGAYAFSGWQRRRVLLSGL